VLKGVCSMYSEPVPPPSVSPRQQEVLITRAKQYRQRQILCAFVVLAAGVLTVGIYGTFYMKSNADKVSRIAVETEFRISSLGVAEMVEATAIDATNLLTTLSGTFRQFPGMSFSQFVDIVSPLRGASHQQAVQWIPKTLASDRARLEADISAYVGRNLTIMELASNNSLVPRGVRDVYFPVAYCDPIQGNERILLFDDTSSPERFEALLASIEQAKPIMTPPIALLQAYNTPGPSTGALVFMPT
jgi:CHASE1-domain containing sensor protein